MKNWIKVIGIYAKGNLTKMIKQKTISNRPLVFFEHIAMSLSPNISDLNDAVPTFPYGFLPNLARRLIATIMLFDNIVNIPPDRNPIFIKIPSYYSLRFCL